MRSALCRTPSLLLALALPAGAALAASMPSGAVEIVSPQAGEALVAGGTMTVEWRPGPGPAAYFEEWEAFLSLDGGASWPIRLTPHLDRRCRRVEVELPGVPSTDARLVALEEIPPAVPPDPEPQVAPPAGGGAPDARPLAFTGATPVAPTAAPTSARRLSILQRWNR